MRDRRIVEVEALLPLPKREATRRPVSKSVRSKLMRREAWTIRGQVARNMAQEHRVEESLRVLMEPPE
jgi:hypothetical protein